jgi:hypothetical protein
VDEAVEEGIIRLLKTEKIIFVLSQSHQSLSTNIQETLKDYDKFEEKFTFDDLDVESQKKVLNETVDFQGKEATLDKLIGEDPTDTKNT